MLRDSGKSNHSHPPSLGSPIKNISKYLALLPGEGNGFAAPCRGREDDRVAWLSVKELQCHRTGAMGPLPPSVTRTQSQQLRGRIEWEVELDESEKRGNVTPSARTCSSCTVGIVSSKGFSVQPFHYQSAGEGSCCGPGADVATGRVQLHRHERLPHDGEAP